MAPAFLPDGEFGAVAVEAGHDENEGGRGGGRGRRREVVVDGDMGSVAGFTMLMRDVNFDYFVFAEAGTEGTVWLVRLSAEK